MAEDIERKGNTFIFGVLLGAIAVAFGVLAYLYFLRVLERPVVTIEAPGFSGAITKDKGVDIEIGKDRN